MHVDSAGPQGPAGQHAASAWGEANSISTSETFGGSPVVHVPNDLSLETRQTGEARAGRSDAYSSVSGGPQGPPGRGASVVPLPATPPKAPVVLQTSPSSYWAGMEGVAAKVSEGEDGGEV